MGNVINDIMSQSASEEAGMLALLFPKKYEQKKQVSEIPPSLMYTDVVMGVIIKRYKSKVLRDFDEEFLTKQKSRDRKGVVELVEMALGMRRMDSGDDGSGD